MPDFREVDPRELRVPPSRERCARCAAASTVEFDYWEFPNEPPSPWVYEAEAGVLVLYDGVITAAWVAKNSPGVTIRVEVIGRLQRNRAADPKIGDLL